MGMEVCVYRTDDKFVLDEETDWSAMDDKLIWYCCGWECLGVDVFNEFADKLPGDDAGFIPRERVREIIEMCEGIARTRKIVLNRALQFPVAELRKLVEEAENDGLGIVTVPTEGLEESDEFTDPVRAAEAGRLKDSLETVLGTWTDDTRLLIILSY